LLEARSLRKSFGPVRALRGVDLQVGRGELVGLFGSNGAGKTTLVRCLASLARPDGGTVLVAGEELSSGTPARVRARLGLVGHQTLLYDSLTAEENLLFYASLYAVPSPRTRVRSLLGEFGLADRAHDAVRGFSRGMQQRLSLARALLHDPDVLLLDEPATGLDPTASAALRERLVSFRSGGGGSLIVSHDIPATLAVVDRYLILSAGRIVDGGPASKVDPARIRDEHFTTHATASRSR
jgi:heme exporter protein A